MGGYRVFSKLPVSLSAPVPLHMKQTIIAAEILALLQALRLHANEPKVAICTDCEYVLKGAQGATLRSRGWVGSAGPVSKITLWKELLQHLDSFFQDILWVKVPSHANEEGNKQADTLANNGRLSNPLYPARKTPKVHSARQRVKRTCKVAARRPASREASPPRPTVLNFEQCHSIASTVTILSDMSEARAAFFRKWTTHAGEGRRSPLTSCSEYEPTGTQTPPASARGSPRQGQESKPFDLLQ